MKTIMVLLAGQTRNSALSTSIDVVTMGGALRDLPNAISTGDRLVMMDGVAVDMLRTLTENNSEALDIIALDDDSDLRVFASNETVDVIVVLGGNEQTLELADAVATALPEATLIPLASSGGAAAAIHSRDPDGYGRDLLDPFSFGRAVRKRLDLSQAPVLSSFSGT